MSAAINTLLPSGMARGLRPVDESAHETRQRLDEWEAAILGPSSGAGVWKWDIRTQKLTLSKSILLMLGYPANHPTAEFDASNIIKWIHSDDIAVAIAAWLRASRSMVPVHEMKLRLRCRDSRYVWVSVRCARIKSSDHQFPQVAGTITDIKEQWLTKEVDDNNAQLEAMLSMSPYGILTFDGDGRVKYRNPAFLQLTDWRTSELIGLDEAAFISALNSRCSQNTRLFALVASEGNFPTSKERALLEIAGSPSRFLMLHVINVGSEAVSKILYLRDVTHERISENTKADFLSMAAHELRSPMAGIRGFSEVMLTQTFSPEQVSEFLTIINANAVRMAGILDDLLDLARIDAGSALQIHLEVLDLSHLIDVAIASFALPEERSAPIYNASCSGVRIAGDAYKIHQVLQNLLSNAYKYSAADTPVEVTLIAHQPGAPDERAGVAVRDHGIGMSPANVLRVGERFFRADKSGEVPGTGLGMSIVKEIMALHGGTMHIESSQDIGTVVSVLFPLPPRAPGCVNHKANHGFD